jgi:uncharacterized protein YjbI with pentapeptide repeats
MTAVSNEKHPVGQKKPRRRLPGWEAVRRRLPGRGAIRIFAALIAVGALLFVFRGYYLENLRDRPLTVLGAATVVAAVVVLIRIGQHYQWTGFGETVQPKPDNQEVQPRKTLWDWLQLFIIPLALAAIGMWFAAQQDARQQQIEDRRAKSAQQIEEQRAQDAALQAYLDQMSQLMLQGDLRGSEEGSEMRTLAQARTQTVLARLDGRRKGSVVRFLYEASLIDKEHPVVSLSAVGLPDDAERVNLSVGLRGADLRGLYLRGVDLSDADPIDADLRAADLSAADLSAADLRRANLRWAILSGAEVRDADLRAADLRDALLSNADLRRADLRGANMNGATLRDADLSEAFLTGADLRGADLSGAKGITEEKLEEQAKTLEGATMPNGSIYD